MKNSDMPAMPSGICEDYNNLAQEPLNLGLTKREHFAAMAMQGLLASDVDAGMSKEICVKLATEHAEALLAELEKTA